MATRTLVPIDGALPCPFCGSTTPWLSYEPTKEGNAKTKYECSVECGGYGCAVHGPSKTVASLDAAAPTALEAWNTRSQNASPLPAFPSSLFAHMGNKS